MARDPCWTDEVKHVLHQARCVLSQLRWITQDGCGSQTDTPALCLINGHARPDTRRVAADGADLGLPRHVPFEGYWRGDSARSWSFPAFPHRRVRLVYGVARLPAYPHFDLEYPIPIDSWLLDFRKHHLRCICGPLALVQKLASHLSLNFFNLQSSLICPSGTLLPTELLELPP